MHVPRKGGDVGGPWTLEKSLCMPGTQLTPALIGTGHILGGSWSKIEVIQLPGEQRRTAEVQGEGQGGHCHAGGEGG